MSYEPPMLPLVSTETCRSCKLRAAFACVVSGVGGALIFALGTGWPDLPAAARFVDYSMAGWNFWLSYKSFRRYEYWRHLQHEREAGR